MNHNPSKWLPNCALEFQLHVDTLYVRLESFVLLLVDSQAK